MDKQKIYFPNLNGLRFVAAFLVIIHHIEQYKSILKIEGSLGSVPFIGIIGGLGVLLFFVLSGFLITYLLLVEEKTFENISVRKFYMRRILRIWPLYFLIITLAFLVLPNIELFVLPGFDKATIYSNLILKLILYAVFLPNIVLSVLGIIPYASHTWSIGTEEQFYLVWPVLLKYFKKYKLALMLFIIVFYRGFSGFLATSFANLIPYKKMINTFWATFNINCMAIGGIYAILYFQKSKYLKILYHSVVFYGAMVLVLLLMIKGVIIPHFHYEGYSILFGIIILNFATNEKIKISLENKVLNYLGNISYGLYMYHPIGIILAITMGTAISFTNNLLLYPLSLLLTIVIAGISYRYFESFFLKYKRKFSNVISGNTTHE